MPHSIVPRSIILIKKQIRKQTKYYKTHKTANNVEHFSAGRFIAHKTKRIFTTAGSERTSRANEPQLFPIENYIATTERVHLEMQPGCTGTIPSPIIEIDERFVHRDNTTQPLSRARPAGHISRHYPTMDCSILSAASRSTEIYVCQDDRWIATGSLGTCALFFV